MNNKYNENCIIKPPKYSNTHNRVGGFKNIMNIIQF